MSRRRPSSRYYRRYEVSGPADLNHRVFLLNQEVSSPFFLQGGFQVPEEEILFEHLCSQSLCVSMDVPSVI